MSATTKIVKLELEDKIPASLAKTIIKDMDPKQELGLLPSQTKEFRDDIRYSVMASMSDITKEELQQKIKESDSLQYFFITMFFNQQMLNDMGKILAFVSGLSPVQKELSPIKSSMNEVAWNVDMQIKIMKKLCAAQADDLIFELYKTYYKKEYKTLRRFKVLTREDLVSIPGNEERIFDPEFAFQTCSDMARVMNIGRIMGIDFDSSIVYALQFMDRVYRMYQNAELRQPKWDKYPEGKIIYDALNANDILGCGTGLYRGFKALNVGKDCGDIERCHALLENTIVYFGNLVNDMQQTIDEVLDVGVMIAETDKVKETVQTEPVPSPAELPKSDSEIQEENDTLKKKIAKLEQDYQYIGELYEKEKGKNAELSASLKDADIEHLELIRLREEMYRMTEECVELEEDISQEEKEEYIGQFRIAIIGGHDNWTYKLKNKFKNWQFYKPEVTPSVVESSLKKADHIYFFTDIMAHSSYYRYMGFVKEYGLDFSYLHTINIPANVNQIYDDLKAKEREN